MSWAVELIDVSVRPELAGVDLGARRGEVTAVTAPSAARHTVFRLVAGLGRPDTGAVLINGQDIGRARGRALARVQRRMAVVFDGDGALFARASVRENVAFAVRSAGRTPRRRVDEVAEQELARHGLLARADARPLDLSPAERRALAMARALALRAPLVVVDGLDAEFGALVRAECDARGTTFLVTVANPAVADACSDVVVTLTQ